VTLGATLSPAEITLIVIGLFAAILIIVIIRVVTHDRRIRRVRLGVFYERDRDDDEQQA
jgi:hypothetical protein